MSSLVNAMRNLMVKNASLEIVDRFIDKVANALPVTKRAALRTLQAHLSAGEPIGMAVKLAFPNLSGEQRGVFASNLCKLAADSDAKTRNFESYNVSPQQGSKIMREKCSQYPGVGPAIGKSFPALDTLNKIPPHAPDSIASALLRGKRMVQETNLPSASNPTMENFIDKAYRGLGPQVGVNARENIGSGMTGALNAAGSGLSRMFGKRSDSADPNDDLLYNVSQHLNSSRGDDLLPGAPNTDMAPVPTPSLKGPRGYGPEDPTAGLSSALAATKPDSSSRTAILTRSEGPSEREYETGAYQNLKPHGNYLLAALSDYASKHPGLTAGLGAGTLGALGVGGLGLYSLLKKKKKKPV